MDASALRCSRLLGLSGPGKELPSELSGSEAGASQTNTAAKTLEKRAF